MFIYPDYAVEQFYFRYAIKIYDVFIILRMHAWMHLGYVYSALARRSDQNCNPV